MVINIYYTMLLIVRSARRIVEVIMVYLEMILRKNSLKLTINYGFTIETNTCTEGSHERSMQDLWMLYS